MSTSGGSQSQSGVQSGNYSGNQGGLNLSQSSTTANVPDYVRANYDRASSAIGSNGLNSAQSAAMGSAGGSGKGGAAGGPSSGGTGMAGMQGAGTGATQPYVNSMGALQPQYQDIANSQYTPFGAQSSNSNVNAQSGAQNMAPYMQGYTNDVVNNSLAGYDNNTANTMNQMRASRGADSAFGDRSAVADAVYKSQSDLGRGQLESNLRNTGFNNAAGYGQQDASRNLQGDVSNQGNAQFNAAQGNQVSQQNAQNAQQQLQTRLAALNSASGNAASASGLAQGGVNINSGLANSLFNMGTTGQGQLINLVGAGNPYVGQTSTNAGLTANSASGSSAGTNQSSGNSKSNGVSL